MSSVRFAAAVLFASSGPCWAIRTSESREASRLAAEAEAEAELWSGASVAPVEGLLGDNSWRAAETRRLARTELAACIDPAAEPDLEGPALPWLGELKAAVHAAASDVLNGSSPHSQTIWRPLEGFAERAFGTRAGNFVSDVGLAYHRAIALTSDRSEAVPPGMDFGDSRCFLFDYSVEPGSIPDPHGCGLFRRSFSRLKALRQCIVGELEASQAWLEYRRAVLEGDRQLSKEEEEEELKEPRPWTSSAMPMDPAAINKVRLDANDRADEMVKYVAFKDWAGLKGGLVELVNRKIKETISKVDLEPATIDSVRAKCFKVEQDSYAELPAESRALKRALPCLSLMWDTPEVSGPPHKPLSNGPFNYAAEKLRKPATVKADLPHTPPVCGRIALAMMQRPLVHSPKGYSPTSCQPGHMTWNKCMRLPNFNCICAEKCWVAALKVACKLSPGCCGDYDAIRRYNSLLPLPF